MLFRSAVNQESVITTVLKLAGYTYGPLLGLFAVGMWGSMRVQDAWVPAVCALAPVASYIVDTHSKEWFGGYQVGFEVLILNGLLTGLGLLLLRAGVRPKSEGRA